MYLVTDTRFLMGLAAGVAAVWLVHHYLVPLPGPNNALRRSAGG